MVDFNNHSQTYSEDLRCAIGFGGRPHAFYLQAKADHLLRIVRDLVGASSTLSALDVGCGAGLFARLLSAHFHELWGVDIASAMVHNAQRICPHGHFHTYDGSALPFADNRFDVVFASCVLHHVTTSDRDGFAREMARVTRPGGLVCVIEHNPLNPLTRLAVSRCPFDADAVLLTCGQARALLRHTGLSHHSSSFFLFTPLGSPWIRAAERAIAWLPLGAQYLVAAIKPVPT